MMRKLGVLAGLIAALALLFVASACRSDKSYRAERFDVDVVVHGDGSATVTETVTLAFSGGPFSYAFRDIPRAQTDGIGRFAVSEGEQAYTPGQGPGQFELRRDGGRERVTWHFAPTQNAARTFTLTYEVAGLIRQEGAQDAMRWTAIPPQHDYPITHSQVLVRLPENVGPLAGAQVLAGRAEPSMLGRQVTFLAQQVERDRALAVGIWFPHGQVQGVPPAWQARQMAQAGRGRWWAALAGLVLVAVAAGTVAAWRRWGRERVPVTRGLLTAPPSDLAPGLAGALLHNGALLSDIIATLFDLGRRGALLVEETAPAGLGRRPGYAFRLLTPPEGLSPFEAWTLQVSMLKAAGRRTLARAERAPGAQPDLAALASLAAAGKVATLGEVAAALQANSGAIERVYADALYGLGLFEHKRTRARRIPAAAGVALLVLALAPVAAAIAWGDLFGAWPLLLAAALGAGGLALLLTGLAAARRGAAGEQAAGDWRAFRRHLQSLARGRAQPAQAELLQRYLPYALAFGLEKRWARQMAAAGAPAPAWFHTLQQDAEAGIRAAAFAGLIGAVAASSHGGGGAAAGAAGGGASGAG